MGKFLKYKFIKKNFELSSFIWATYYWKQLSGSFPIIPQSYSGIDNIEEEESPEERGNFFDLPIF